MNKKLVVSFGICVHTVSHLRRYCSSMPKSLAFETPHEADILVFGVSNAKYLEFDTPDENALETTQLAMSLSLKDTSKFRVHLVELLNNSFSVFKQHYTHFHTLFYSHEFQKTINNNTQTLLSNRPLIVNINNNARVSRFSTIELANAIYPGRDGLLYLLSMLYKGTYI